MATEGGGGWWYFNSRPSQYQFICKNFGKLHALDHHTRFISTLKKYIALTEKRGYDPPNVPNSETPL